MLNILACRTLGREPVIHIAEGDPTGPSRRMSPTGRATRRSRTTARGICGFSATVPACPHRPDRFSPPTGLEAELERLVLAVRSIRVRKCPEAGRIFRKLRARHDPNFKRRGRGTRQWRAGGSPCAAATSSLPASRRQTCSLQSLAPYALEAAVSTALTTTSRSRSSWPAREAGRVAMSRLRLDQIEPLLEELVPGDRVKLIEKLRMSPSGEARLATP